MTFPGLGVYPGLGTFPGASGSTERVAPPLLTIDGLDFGVDDGETLLVYDTLTGWHGGPGSRSSFADRPNAHGSFDAPVYREERVVTVGGWAYSDMRSKVLLAIRKVTGCLAEGQMGDVTVDDPDEGKLTIQARLTDGPLVAWDSFDHCWTWQFQVTAPDPLKYGPTVSSPPTPLPSAGASGLAFPLFGGTGKLEFGAPGATGLAVVSNPGTADTTALFTVTGPVLGGLVIADVATSSRIVYAGDVPAGALLVIDSADGHAWLNGANRDSELTVSQWWLVKAGTRCTVAFSTLGVPGQAGFLTVSIRPANW